jgi:hypothetical protein
MFGVLGPTIEGARPTTFIETVGRMVPDFLPDFVVIPKNIPELSNRGNEIIFHVDGW